MRGGSNWKLQIRQGRISLNITFHYNFKKNNRLTEFQFIQITGIQNPGRTVTVVVRGSNKLVLEEAERSLHDALCVIRCLVKQPAILAGGGAPEIQMSMQLGALSRSVTGVDSYCFRAYANALEVSLCSFSLTFF